MFDNGLVSAASDVSPTPTAVTFQGGFYELTQSPRLYGDSSGVLAGDGYRGGGPPGLVSRRRR